MTRTMRMTPMRDLMLATGLAMLTMIAAATMVRAAEVQPAADKGMFGPLLGTWGGGGMMALDDGKRSRLSCNGYYTGGGSQLRLAIYCKSDFKDIKMRGKVSYSGGRLSGTWEERSYNADGTLSGTARPGKLAMSIGGLISGSMNVSYSGSRQNVSITTSGVALRSVNINLSRR